MTTHGPKEFDCKGCGQHIFAAIVFDDLDLCAFCRNLGVEESIKLQRMIGYLDEAPE